MFRSAGWKVLKRDIRVADLIQFTGGHDVSPNLYGEAEHAHTSTNPLRDNREMLIFQQGLALEIPMAGICRGAQFLNVMCGGSLYQHVDGHANGIHKAVDIHTGEAFKVTSTHHQMMITGTGADTIITANCSSKKERMKTNYGIIVIYDNTPMDVEAVYYPRQNCFCFQPHPEFEGQDELAVRYLDYVEDLCFRRAALSSGNG